MHPSIVPLAAIFRLNTELLLNCLEDLDEDRASLRGTPPVNSIAFLVAHMTETRHFATRLLGTALASPFSDAFTRARSLDDAGPLPPLAVAQAAWERISAQLAVQLQWATRPSWRNHRSHSRAPTVPCWELLRSWPSTRAIISARSPSFAGIRACRRCTIASGPASRAVAGPEVRPAYRIAVFGNSGRTGRALLENARERGFYLVRLARPATWVLAADLPASAPYAAARWPVPDVESEIQGGITR